MSKHRSAAMISALRQAQGDKQKNLLGCFSEVNRLRLFLIAFFAFSGLTYAVATADSLPVTRATLANGLRVVVVKDTLAPVVTTIMNYKVGGDDQPIDGLAHATEHMMFRGSKTVSESQLSDISAITGGNNDADTQNEVTQYFFSMPSQYLDIALRLEAARARNLTLSQTSWNIERGAILNEVTQDNSIAVFRAARRVTLGLLAGTPYANDVLGTVTGFSHKINAPQLRAFYDAWYHPNNAILIITGDVDGPAALAKVKTYFSSIPSAPLPSRKRVVLLPVRRALYHEDSDQPASVILVGYRFPGFRDPDYAASQILQSVLNNQRSDLYGLVAGGKSLYTGMQSSDFPRASAAFVINVVPIAKPAAQADAELRSILSKYRKDGVPADLVEAAKARAIADAEFKGNSIEGLAFEWSQALAVEGRSDPNQFLSGLRRVSVADVNRVLRKYLNDAHSVAVYAVPKNLGKINPNAPREQAPESNKLSLTHHDPLPSWALALLKQLRVPPQTVHPADTTLANGLRLIVVPERVTSTVVVRGEIKSNPAMQAPPGKDGVADITEPLLAYGTRTYSRLAFRRELDKIAADVDAGTSFTLRVLSDRFERGLALLADEELHPAFPPADFTTVKAQTIDALRGEADSPEHLVAVALANALYPAGDPARRFASVQSVQAVSLGDVQRYYATVFRPDMTTVVVIGDTTPALAQSLVQKYFGEWHASGIKPNVEPAPVPDNKAADMTIPATGRVQSSVRLSETLRLTRLDEDWAPLRLATAVVGSGGNSILFHDLRDRHGYVYSVNAALAAQRTRSTFDLSFASDPGKVSAAQSLAIADLTQAQRALLPSTDVLFGKAMLVSAVPLREESYGGVADLLLGYAGLGLPLDQNLIDAQRQLSVTPQALREVMAKWIRPNDFVRVIEAPPAK